MGISPNLGTKNFLNNIDVSFFLFFSLFVLIIFYNVIWSILLVSEIAAKHYLKKKFLLPLIHFVFFKIQFLKKEKETKKIIIVLYETFIFTHKKFGKKYFLCLFCKLSFARDFNSLKKKQYYTTSSIEKGEIIKEHTIKKIFNINLLAELFTVQIKISLN